MRILLHRGFLDSHDALGTQDRRRTREALTKLETQPAASGLRWHKVANGFDSLSPSMSVRVIGKKFNDKVILYHVDRHDAAYSWAERHVPVADETTDVFELVTISQRDVEAPVPTLDQDFWNSLMKRLQSNHVPAHMVATFEDCRNDDDVLEHVRTMSPEWQEVILKIVAGESLSPGDIPTSSSSVRVLADDLALSDALALPVSRWRLFLHPRQQTAVEASDRVMSVLGGPGTGKSVVCAHRAVYLSQRRKLGDVIVVFTYAWELVRYLRKMVEELLPNRTSDQTIWVLPCDTALGKPRDKAVVFLQGDRVVLKHRGAIQRVSSIIVDEYQDCFPEFVNFLNKAIKTNCDFITVALDMQQAIMLKKGTQQVKEFVGRSRVVKLPYCYRMTRPLLEAATSVMMRYAPEYLSFLDIDHGLNIPFAVVDGPSVRFVLARDSKQLVAEVAKAVRELELKYGDPDSLCVIHLQYFSTNFQKSGRVDPLAESLRSEPSIGRYYEFGFWSKGKEYLAGVVVCPKNFLATDFGPENILRLNTMYMTLTRFRQELVVVCELGAPVAKYFPVPG